MAAAGLVKPPVGALQGYVDDGHFYALLTEQLESVPNLIWPFSNYEYAQMRRDPQLAAVLAGLMLPIRRANWALDPTGCRPEVAQLCADDMGLIQLGQDNPGAARTRGVSWSEHLRVALQKLVFGSMGFEMEAAFDDAGQARLTGLYERMPQSIAFIHSSSNGNFLGITQHGFGGRLEAPEIDANRLVWYVHEREGSAWHGASILRPGYAAYTIKREMLRVAAISHRRFGMGVPTVEWAPGSQPTPAAYEEAQRAASAARVGETSGMTLPPGAKLVLTGMSGGAPNTLEFMRWLDNQMSGMVLSRWMDLGSTQTGSRALGSSFIDIFMLSLQSIALSIADVATRQIAARLVEWNWGDSEPVPKVVVSDVGSRHEVTADALMQLVSSGAMSADPALEEWVRKTYSLPPRSIPWVPPPVRGGGGGGKTPGGLPVDDGSAPVAAKAQAAGRRKSRGRPVTEGQTALPIAGAAADTAGELLDPQVGLAAALADLRAQWPDAVQPMVDDLSAQAGDAVDNDDLGALGTLVASAAALAGVAAVITAAMLPLAAGSAAATVAAAVAQGAKKVKAPKNPGADRVAQVAQATAGVIANGYSSAAARKALQISGGSATADEVIAAVTQALADMSASDKGWATDNLAAALFAAQNAGQAAVFELHPPTYLTADESHDSANRCQPCTDVNGKRYETVAEATKDYPVFGFGECLGGSRCRGRLRGHWN